MVFIWVSQHMHYLLPISNIVRYRDVINMEFDNNRMGSRVIQLIMLLRAMYNLVIPCL